MPGVESRMAASYRHLTLTAALVAIAAITGQAQRLPDTTTRIVAAAQAVASSLDDAGRAKLQFPFDSPQKGRWSNLPSPMFQRFGIRLTDLTPPQRDAVMRLLSVALSTEGYQKVVDIMRGDEILKRNSGGRSGPAAGRFHLLVLELRQRRLTSIDRHPPRRGQSPAAGGRPCRSRVPAAGHCRHVGAAVNKSQEFRSYSPLRLLRLS